MKRILTIVLCCHIYVISYGKIYNIKSFGAKPGNLCTKAIQKAIDVCYRDGGGTVLVPNGNFITGTIVLRSNINLHMLSGASLSGRLNLNDYGYNSRKAGIIFCEDAEHVSITGEGTIDASGMNFLDTTKSHTYKEFDRQLTRQKDNYLPEGQFFSDGPYAKLPKPGMTIAFFHCNKIIIKDIKIKNTPSWAIRLAYCDDALIQNININNNLMIPNSDGIHCTTSKNIKISDCNIKAGDDALIVTGFTLDEDTPGFNINIQNEHKFGNKTKYAENIVVNNCILQSRSSAIRIGYGQHPIRRCLFNNIVIYESNRGIGIYAHDEADIEELIFSNITIETRLHNGQWWGNGEPIHISAISRFNSRPAGKISNIQFNNIIATGGQGILLYGDEKVPMEDITFNNISLKVEVNKETMQYGGNFDLRPCADPRKQIFQHDIAGLYARYVNNLAIDKFKLSWGKSLPSFFTHGLECEYVNKLYISNSDITSNPESVAGKKTQLKETTLVIKE